MTAEFEPLKDRKLTPWKGFMGVFAAVFTIVVAVGALISFSMPSTYVGVARVQVPDAGAIEQFRSDKTLDAVIQKLDLKSSYGKRYGEAEGLTLERTRDILRRSLVVKRRWAGDSPAVEVRFFSRDPREAADLANAVVEAGVVQLESSATSGQGSDRRATAVLDRAVLPRKPARPNHILNLVLAAVVGAFLGVMAGGVGARVAVGPDRRDLERGRRTEDGGR